MLFFLLVTCVVFSQRKPELDTERAQKMAVKKTVLNFFEGFHSGDTTMMKKTIHKDLIMQTIYRNKEGKDILHKDDTNKFIEAIANRPKTERWDERLLLFKIQIDDYMANVWTPYEFWHNEQFSHCGVNSFQLFNDNGTWKIIYLVDTRRKKGCRD